MVLMFTTATLASYSQLSLPSNVIGEYKEDNVNACKLQVSSDMTYEWIYVNWEKSKRGNKCIIKFKGDNKTVEQLYNILDAQQRKPHATEYSFNLGDKTLNLFTTDKDDNGYGLLIHIDDTYFAMNEKQLNKLFGKK